MRDTKTHQRGDGEPRAKTPPPENPAPATVEQESPASRGTFLVFVSVAVVAIFAAYANHFHNSFHFDDAHTIEQNVYIRNLHNIPRFFTDATTFSSLPANQTWRPIVSLSLALDYRLGKGPRSLLVSRLHIPLVPGSARSDVFALSRRLRRSRAAPGQPLHRSLRRPLVRPASRRRRDRQLRNPTRRSLRHSRSRSRVW